jgi:competence protein ComEA
MHNLHALIFAVFTMLSVPAGAAPVDINSADAAMLAAAIDGVGEKKAVTIVRHRETHGPFSRIEDLANVKGIGSSTVERNRDSLTVLPAASAEK